MQVEKLRSEKSFSESDDEEEELLFMSVDNGIRGVVDVGIRDDSFGTSSESDEEEDEPSFFLLASFPLKTA